MTRPFARTAPATLFGGRFTPAAAVASALARVVLTWHQRHTERSALSRLDAHMIRDIGLTPNAVADETAKPFWRD